MEGTTFYDMAELVREAALQEAASRAKTRSPLNLQSTAAASTLAAAAQRISAEAEGEAEELFAVYEDEKAKNDVLARTLDQVSFLLVDQEGERSVLLTQICFDHNCCGVVIVEVGEARKAESGKVDADDVQKRLERELATARICLLALEKGEQRPQYESLFPPYALLNLFSPFVSLIPAFMESRKSTRTTARSFCHLDIRTRAELHDLTFNTPRHSNILKRN